MNHVVEVRNLTKEFKGKKAVNQINFSIRKGEITAVLGPNGAGKTTTILMVLGLLQPTNGQVKIFGKDPRDKVNRQNIGVMLQEVSVMDSLKVKEIIKLVQSYYDNPLSFEEILALTGLAEEDLSRRTEKLSGGQKRKVNFALAIAGNPDLLFFDEPTVGMDVSARKIFWNTVNRLAREGKTIIFTTHYLQEADDYANRILLISNGQLVQDDTPQVIKQKISKQSVSFVLYDTFPKERFTSLDFVSEMEERGNRIYLFTEDVDRLLATIYTEKFPVKDIQIEKGRLEEAFEKLTV